MQSRLLPILLLSFAVFFLGCEEIHFVEKIDGYNVYRIKEGGHSSSSKVCDFSGDHVEFEVRFDSSCIYNIGGDQSDINKLYGFSDCNNSNIHQNSARFGWRWMNDSLDLFSYTYVGGNGPYKNKIKNIKINQSYKCKIQISDSTYLFYVDNEVLDTTVRGCSVSSAQGYYSYPYFGGDIEAPHEIVVLIKDPDYDCFDE